MSWRRIRQRRVPHGRRRARRVCLLCRKQIVYVRRANLAKVIDAPGFWDFFLRLLHVWHQIDAWKEVFTWYNKRLTFPLHPSIFYFFKVYPRKCLKIENSMDTMGRIAMTVRSFFFLNYSKIGIENLRRAHCGTVLRGLSSLSVESFEDRSSTL